MNERDVDADQVREEHLAEVHIGAQWLYLIAVPGLGMVLMLLTLLVLDAT